MKQKLLLWSVPVALFVLLASACTHDLSRNIYEGIKTHEESLNFTPLEKPRAASPSYEEYGRERRALSPGNAQ